MLDLLFLWLKTNYYYLSLYVILLPIFVPPLMMALFAELELLLYPNNNNNIDSTTNNDSTSKDNNKLEESETISTVKHIPFEEKYLIKFKSLINDYTFTTYELEQEQQLAAKLLAEYTSDKNSKIKSLTLELKTIEQLIEKYKNQRQQTIDNKNVNSSGDLNCESNCDSESESDDPILNKIISLDTRRIESQIELQNLENDDKNLCFFLQEARKQTIDQKCDKLINNYVMECTPSGNVYMRYNHKDSIFEYYSDDTMSYSYLEVVGRKYAVYFQCKPIYHYVEPVPKKLTNSNNKFEINISRNNLTNNSNINSITNPNNNRTTTKNNSNITKSDTMLGLRPSMTRRKPSPLLVNKTNSTTSAEPEVLTNKYKRIGLLKDASLIKSIPVQKVAKISYAEFKKIKEKQI